MLASTAPTTKEGIEKYLGSGMVKGIGPIYAKKLVAAFGERILTSSRKNRPRLEDVEGIGPKRRTRIKEAWLSRRLSARSWCSCTAMASARAGAVRIYKTYGEMPLRRFRPILTRWPKTSTASGSRPPTRSRRKIGIPVDSLIRACAGLSHVLLEATGDGHCALPVELLRDEAGKLLLVDDKIVTEALERTLASHDLVKEPINGQELVFLPHSEAGRGNHRRPDQEPLRLAVRLPDD